MGWDWCVRACVWKQTSDLHPLSVEHMKWAKTANKSFKALIFPPPLSTPPTRRRNLLLIQMKWSLGLCFWSYLTRGCFVWLKLRHKWKWKIWGTSVKADTLLTVSQRKLCKQHGYWMLSEYMASQLFTRSHFYDYFPHFTSTHQKYGRAHLRIKICSHEKCYTLILWNYGSIWVAIFILKCNKQKKNGNVLMYLNWYVPSPYGSKA